MTSHPCRAFLTVMALCAGVTGQTCMDSNIAFAQSGPAAARSPVPNKDASETSSARLKEIFGNELTAAVSPKSKSALAKQFVTQADATENAADRWVLLSEALRLATDAGDAVTAIPLIDRIPAEYEVEGRASRLEALSRLVPKVAQAESTDLARRCLDLARDIEGSVAKDLAPRAVSVATAAARKSKNADLVAEATRMAAKQKDRQKIDKELQSIRAKLNVAPDDPEVRLEAGQFLCFRAGQWKEGLLLLEKGSDPQLAAIARIELASETSSADHVRLGDAITRRRCRKQMGSKKPGSRNGSTRQLQRAAAQGKPRRWHCCPRSMSSEHRTACRKTAPSTESRSPVEARSTPPRC